MKTFSVWMDVLCFFKICNKPKNTKFFWFDVFKFIFQSEKSRLRELVQRHTHKELEAKIGAVYN